MGVASASKTRSEKWRRSYRSDSRMDKIKKGQHKAYFGVVTAGVKVLLDTEKKTVKNASLANQLCKTKVAGYLQGGITGKEHITPPTDKMVTCMIQFFSAPSVSERTHKSLKITPFNTSQFPFNFHSGSHSTVSGDLQCR